MEPLTPIVKIIRNPVFAALTITDESALPGQPTERRFVARHNVLGQCHELVAAPTLAECEERVVAIINKYLKKHQHAGKPHQQPEMNT